MQCSSPRASAGLSMLPASIAPSALPAPTMVWISSMKTMVLPSSCATSLSTLFSRSSNSPRNLAPASSSAMSRTSTRLSFRRVGHLAGDDALGQALDDRRLADARLADQHRVVLGPPLQHLDGAADLVVAADHRVELAGAGALGQVEGVLLQRLALAFGFGAVDLLAAAHRLDRRLERRPGDAVLLQQRADRALRVGRGEDEHLAGDELVAALVGLPLGRLQQVRSARGRAAPPRRPAPAAAWRSRRRAPSAAGRRWRRRATSSAFGPSGWASIADSRCAGSM